MVPKRHLNHFSGGEGKKKRPGKKKSKLNEKKNPSVNQSRPLSDPISPTETTYFFFFGGHFLSVARFNVAALSDFVNDAPRTKTRLGQCVKRYEIEGKDDSPLLAITQYADAPSA